MESIKTEARRRIIAIANEDRQRNMIARTVELITEHGADRSEWPKDARAESERYASVWQRIKALRAFSDKLENAAVEIDITAAAWPFGEDQLQHRVAEKFEAG